MRWKAVFMRDRGSMLVLVLFVGLGVTAAIAAAMVPLFADLVDRQRAMSAADAAALLGVVEGRAAAAALAARNDATLVTWHRDGHEVTVTVRVGDQTIRARASDGP